MITSSISSYYSNERSLEQYRVQADSDTSGLDKFLSTYVNDLMTTPKSFDSGCARPIKQGKRKVIQIAEEEKKIEEIKRIKSGEIWECTRVVREKDGLIYGFQMRAEFLEQSELDRKNSEINPALEPGEVTLKPKNGEPNILNRLGYSFTYGSGDDRRPTLWLPDIETLRSRMKELGCDIPIASSSGVAGDEEFSKAHLESHVLLSSGKEFVHDHILHLLPAFMKYFKMDDGSKFEYREIREWMLFNITRIVGIIEDMQKLIGKLKWNDTVLDQKHIDLFWASLSSWIDVQTNKWIDISEGTIPDELQNHSLADMIDNFQENFNYNFGPKTKEKYGPLEDKDFEELHGLRHAYRDRLNKAAPVQKKSRRPACCWPKVRKKKKNSLE